MVYLVNNEANSAIRWRARSASRSLVKLILDCLNRTENAMTQAHAFKAAELCVKAQMLANAAD